MPYISIKTIRNRRYRYLQRSYREAGRVRTESRYLGPAYDYDEITARGLAVAERAAEKSDAYQRSIYNGKTWAEVRDAPVASAQETPDTAPQSSPDASGGTSEEGSEGQGS